MRTTTTKLQDIERIDPFTLWCGACGRKLIKVLSSFMCVCGEFAPATLSELPSPAPGSMWRHTGQGWIAKVEDIKSAMFGDEVWLEIVAAMDTALLGRKVWCSIGFLRDRCHPYTP